MSFRKKSLNHHQRPQHKKKNSTVGATECQAFGENVRLGTIRESCGAVFCELGIHLL